MRSHGFPPEPLFASFRQDFNVALFGVGCFLAAAIVVGALALGVRAVAIAIF